MYITNFTHYLDPEGNIPITMPKEARELANFLALVIDASTDYESESGFETGIRCFNEGCEVTIQNEFLFDQNHEIHWKCNKSDNEGLISVLEGSKWDRVQ